MLLCNQRPLGISKWDSAVVFDCTMAALVCLSHRRRSRRDLFFFLLPVPQTPCQALSDTSFFHTNRRKKLQSFRGAVLKSRDAKEWKMSDRGRLEVNHFNRLRVALHHFSFQKRGSHVSYVLYDLNLFLPIKVLQAYTIKQINRTELNTKVV